MQHSVLHQLLAKVRREQFETWFRSLRINRVDDHEMEFSVTSQFARDWIQKNHLATLREVACTDGRKRSVLLSLRAEDGWDSLAMLGMEATLRPSGGQPVRERDDDELDAAAQQRGAVDTGPVQDHLEQGQLEQEQQGHQQGQAAAPGARRARARQRRAATAAGTRDAHAGAAFEAPSEEALPGDSAGTGTGRTGSDGVVASRTGPRAAGNERGAASRDTGAASRDTGADSRDVRSRPGDAPRVPTRAPHSGSHSGSHHQGPQYVDPHYPGGSHASGGSGHAPTSGAYPSANHGHSSHGHPPAGGSYPGQASRQFTGFNAPLRLNPNYTFDKFVVGPCNRLGHASALAIGENPGSAYNPMFLHGNVGLGKTHLLQAICHTVTKRDPSLRVLYLSCEDFTNTFINAIQTGSLDEFRNIHRRVDVLVIDDVQFLANKEKTQEEFFHTFNSLYDAQKQIVMSSDRPPVEIPTIEERLVSRFKWGLVAEIEAPCFETRVAIVRRKAKGRGVELSDDVSCYIAERVTTNIRELEGAVIKVVGIAAITDRPITTELAEEALRGVAVTRVTQISVDDVIGLITSEFAISARDLTGKSRTQAISLPRQIAMYLLREHTELSLEDIGRVFGNRDHTTVLYAVTKIRDRSQTDRLFKDLLEGLASRLLGRPSR